MTGCLAFAGAAAAEARQMRAASLAGTGRAAGVGRSLVAPPRPAVTGNMQRAVKEQHVIVCSSLIRYNTKRPDSLLGYGVDESPVVTCCACQLRPLQRSTR
mmetsp:Transcript_10055/g.30107  ORF Transcript_10055/g.30107 Transcript_10055/m.30107 type:complete len:101 (-) Transcript_10055:106-408(-)